MSKTETTPAATEKVSTKRTYEGYDAELVLQSKEVPVEYEVFTDAAELPAIMAKLNELGQWRDAANFLIKREALKNARASAGLAGGINREVLMNFIKPYRELPQFAAMVTATDKRKATAEEWNKQTDAILQFIKNIPTMLDIVKQLSAAQAPDSEE